MTLSYGRRSGYGAYGVLKAGARIFELDNSSHDKFEIHTWIREFDGTKVIQ